MDEKLKIERQKPCAHCGSVVYVVEPGRGPHVAHLRCEGCNRGGVWMGKQEFQVIQATYPDIKFPCHA